MHPHAGHALVFRGPVNNLHEAPSVGNGDLGALVQVFQNEFRLHLGKNDVFDSRFDFDNAKAVYPQDKLIRASRDYGFRLEGGNYSARPAWDRPPPPELEYPDDQQGWNRHPFPCPKPAGTISIRHSGTSTTVVETVVDIARGTITSTFAFDHVWHAPGKLTVEAFVETGTNAVRLRLRAEGLVGTLHLAVGKAPDAIDPSVPLPEIRLTGARAGVVAQRLPAEHGAESFSWRLAAAFPAEGRPVEALPFELLQKLTLSSGQSAELSVGVATTRETPEPDARALAHAAAGGFEARHPSHLSRWSHFWDASGIELEDKDLEACWYRNLFALNTHIREGAVAPGLCANVVPYEMSPWHGVYTVNMNIQKMFLAALPANHPEWIACYADWLDAMRPSMERLCRLTFGFDGIYIPHMVLPFVKPERQFTTNTSGRALGMTGWMGQPLWWHWEYTRDRVFLEKRAYPYLRRAADFYVRYREMFGDASGDLFPSLNLESPPWTRDFAHNRDCLMDLILVRKTFDYAIAAAEALEVDAEERRVWRAAREAIRPFAVDRLPDGGSWIRGDKNDLPPADPAARETRALRSAQAVAAAWTVFPGEYADGDEPDGLAAVCREIMTRTRWHELHPEMVWIHHWWCALPALRMGLDNAFAVARDILLKERFPAGHARTTHYIHLQPDAWRAPEDNYLGVVAVTEMLLQSPGGLLRLFPAWPRGKRARFRGFPARGGFVVDAEWSPETGLAASIRSLAGGPCRLRWLGREAPVILCGGRRTDSTIGERSVAFETVAGESYAIRLTPSEAGSILTAKGESE